MKRASAKTINVVLPYYGYARQDRTAKPHEPITVYIVQSTNAPVNDYYMELLIMIDAMKRASAKTINVVLPYYGYARQDRTAKPHEPIT
ncbi:hypothetical protein CP987_19115, partial [Morganella morganii]